MTRAGISGAVIGATAKTTQKFPLIDKGIVGKAIVKTDNASYSGTLTEVDADSSGNTCTSDDYTTLAKYYDSNDNDIKENDEKEIYAIITDSNGCFAVKMPPGNYDIYG